MLKVTSASSQKGSYDYLNLLNVIPAKNCYEQTCSVSPDCPLCFLVLINQEIKPEIRITGCNSRGNGNQLDVVNWFWWRWG